MLCQTLKCFSKDCVYSLAICDKCKKDERTPPMLRPQRPLGGLVKNDVCVSICAARVGPLRRARRSPPAPWCECKGTLWKARPPMAESARRRQNRVDDSDGPEQQKISWQMLPVRDGMYFSPLHDNDTKIMRPIKCAPDNSLFIRGWRPGGGGRKMSRGHVYVIDDHSTRAILFFRGMLRSALKSNKIDKRLL